MLKPIPDVSDTHLARFMAKLRVAPSGCVEWTASKDGCGYGTFRVGSKIYRSHRLAFKWLGGNAVPEHGEIMHTCDNPACVNPEHLVHGSHTENMHDMISKGRDRKASGDRHYYRNNPCLVRGERHNRHILTAEQVLEIRASDETHKAAAARFGVSESCIYHVRARHNWKHI